MVEDVRPLRKTDSWLDIEYERSRPCIPCCAEASSWIPDIHPWFQLVIPHPKKFEILAKSSASRLTRLRSTSRLATILALSLFSAAILSLARISFAISLTRWDPSSSAFLVCFSAACSFYSRPAIIHDTPCSTSVIHSPSADHRSLFLCRLSFSCSGAVSTI